MKKHIDDARSHLSELQGLASKTEAAERKILQSAESRLTEVSSAIDRLRPGVQAAPEASQSRYLSLIEERGQLHQVIAKARAALS